MQQEISVLAIDSAKRVLAVSDQIASQLMRETGATSVIFAMLLELLEAGENWCKMFHDLHLH